MRLSEPFKSFSSRETACFLRFIYWPEQAVPGNFAQLGDSLHVRGMPERSSLASGSLPAGAGMHVNAFVCWRSFLALQCPLHVPWQRIGPGPMLPQVTCTEHGPFTTLPPCPCRA